MTEFNIIELRNGQEAKQNRTAANTGAIFTAAFSKNSDKKASIEPINFSLLRIILTLLFVICLHKLIAF